MVELDLRPMIRAAVGDLFGGHAACDVSARFRATMVDATATTVAQLLARTGLRRVVLSGGSMQNRLLERGLAERLNGHLVMAHDVPLNDGGIALGQAHAAVLTLLSEST